MGAPRLDIDLRKLHHNAHTLVRRFGVKGVSVTGMTKAVLGLPDVAKVFLDAGVCALGDSRVENVENMRKAGIKAPIILTRSPMLSQIERAVVNADISFNTEIDVICALSDAAQKVGLVHGIVLMVELGDLREGIMPDNVERIVRKTLELPNIEFKGIGTNLACRSGVSPDAKNMSTLSALADSIDAIFGVEMEIVSGGNSANIEWAFGDADMGRVNNLRLGEAILLGRNPLTRTPIEGLYTDSFQVAAEVIESKVKPSQPWGKIAQSAFGSPPENINQGDIHQVLLAIGEQDIDEDGLTSSPKVTILGVSSDHLILNAGNSELSVGDEVTFQLNYSALVRAATSPFVVKSIVHI
ncbi:alanine/ornithine racemase family PLP-dependent enzyme [Candidatus Puniceispirillum sp.]|nr:alanine/ornithine racemase family PLP-dependent enzyme [Alphaproteobacteria bacterium]MDC1293893.1 alanine/ornithine racemase family PLP-dependent enzyme [Candidatus Puniceispirillum sp.]